MYILALLICDTLNCFQGSIPHGIDVLRVTDFYAVSIRRNAFLVAAPQVVEWVTVFRTSR